MSGCFCFTKSAAARALILISHCDCYEDAKFVGDLITERFGFTNIVYNYINTVIGSHSGPGTVALFFLGDKR